MSNPLPINAKLKAEVKADLTHSADKVTDTVTEPVAESCKGIKKLFSALLGPWIAIREGQRKCIEAQYEKISLDILAGHKEWDFPNKKAIPANNILTMDALCNELVQMDSSCKAKRLEAAMFEAAKEIKQIPEEEISDEPPNQTFFNHWRAEAELIDDNDLRAWWSHLLVEEIRRTNVISPRTLDVAKNITVEEARLFSSLQQYIIAGYLIVPLKTANLGNSVKLQDAGLIGNTTSAQVSIQDSYGEKIGALVDKKSKLVIIVHASSFIFSAYPLTLAGRELSNIDPFCHSQDSLKRLIQEMGLFNHNVFFTIHQWLGENNGQLLYDLLPLWTSEKRND